MGPENIIQQIKLWRPHVHEALIQKAYLFAQEAHRGQKRMSGEDHFEHCRATALTLATWGMDDHCIAAGLLHDTLEDTETLSEELEETFGADITRLVEGASKLKRLKYRGIERYVENLRKMCIAMAEDVRVIVIKFADRIHNLETLHYLPKAKQERIALESVEIYAAIANRLGMGEIKGQIEDLAFPYILPEEHVWLLKKIEKPRETKIQYLKSIQQKLENIFRENDLKYVSVHGRAKHLYSLYQKLLRYNRDIAKIYDLVALRVVVDKVSDCYNALGIIHENWKPLKGRIKDYIAQPKPNGYRSLHTTAFCDDGEIVEFQIRNREMHEEAEFGSAAHWQYTESKKKSAKKIKQPMWIKQLARLQGEIKDEKQFLESLKIDVFKNRIFVFTPLGDVIDLPEDATPVDFAYQIHTEIGHRCSGVKINDNIASLSARLKSGDVVEIFTDKNREGPRPEWLEFIVTSTAKMRIRNWLNKNKPEFIQEKTEPEKKVAKVI